MDSSTEINLKEENEQELPGYIPTKEELIKLVKFWYMEILDIDWLWFARGYSCNAWKYRQRFASGRLNRAEKAIGEEAVKQAIKEVRDKFKAGTNARIWDIYENGTAEQREAAHLEMCRREGEVCTSEDRNRLVQLEEKFRGDFLAMVFNAREGDQCEVALFSQSASALIGVLQASRKFEILTDGSRLESVEELRYYQFMGFLRIARSNGSWLFEFPYSEPGTARWDFLESVASEIKEVLHADAGKGSQPA